jgi:hypothetical protein
MNCAGTAYRAATRSRPCHDRKLVAGSNTVSRRAKCLIVALPLCSQCVTWTSFHAGAGTALDSKRTVVGVDVGSAMGTVPHGTTFLVAARAEGNPEYFAAEVRSGLMRPFSLTHSVTISPAATVDLARLSRVGGDWYGSALGPSIAVEVLWWRWYVEQKRQTPYALGCMGGAVGVDCPNTCTVVDVGEGGWAVRVV